MIRKAFSALTLVALMIILGACHNKNVKNPIADLGSKQPDKVLFDRAMEAMKSNKYDVARLTLQTLINTYPDSEYIARAKLAIGDAWYAEGNSAALVQAENEYKDFETFFPNMAEAAEAQLKIANIHYRQMEKPDRDFTHAKRAEEEYRQLILQYPDSKLTVEAKQHLLEVQEVLAEREFRVGRFYFLRESYPASIARLRSLVDSYPLYSQADEALYMLGDAYERQVEMVRSTPRVNEAIKGSLIKKYDDQAVESFTRLITRYPLEARAEDAKRRLEAMGRPVPTPTPEAIAQNKHEQEGRGERTLLSRMMTNMHRGPDVVEATKNGEPTLTDPKLTGAPDILRQNQAIVSAASGNAGSGAVSIETVKQGTPGPNQPIPRSEESQSPQQTGIDELTPSGGNDSGASNEAASSTSGQQQIATPPPQVNEVQTEATKAATPQATDNGSISSSKAKKKKGLGKLNPF